MLKCFTEHPSRANQTYFEHMFHAFYFARESFSAGLKFMMHGICPFMCDFTGSEQIGRLNDELVTKKASLNPPTSDEE